MKTLILIAFVFHVMQSAIAQISDTNMAYWKLHTDAIAKATTVTFFNANRYPVYQEVLDDKYIKLTKRNRRKLDNILLQITQRNLVAKTAKLEELNEPVKRVAYKVNEYVVDKWLCNSTIIRQSLLQINIQNPKSKKLFIQLNNSRGEAIFVWHLTHTDFKLYNLEHLQSDTYQLVISDGQSNYSQDIFISTYPLRRQLINKPTYKGTFAF